MKMSEMTMYIAMFIALFFAPITHSCTTVFANHSGPHKVVARTMDLFTSDEPQIEMVSRGTNHSGEVGENPLHWHAKYGSVVITAFHTSAVSDGMNEKGLAAHLLYLAESEYPQSTTNKHQISNMMWAQYVLDHFATVAEALQGTQNLTLVPTEVHGRTWPCHLAIEDASGDSAVIEFIHGKAHIYHGQQYQIMTNEPAYTLQLAHLKHYKLFGGKRPLPGDTDPLSRFVRVSTYLKTLPTALTQVDAVASVLSVIRSAMVPFGAENTSEINAIDAWVTRWVSVADVSDALFFFQSTTAPNLVWFDLKKIDFTKTSKMLDPASFYLDGDMTAKLMV